MLCEVEVKNQGNKQQMSSLVGKGYSGKLQVLKSQSILDS